MSKQLKIIHNRLLDTEDFETDPESNENSKKLNFSFRDKLKGKTILGFFTEDETGLRGTVINTNYQSKYVREKLKKKLSSASGTAFRTSLNFNLSGSRITTDAYYDQLNDDHINNTYELSANDVFFSIDGSISDCNGRTLNKKYNAKYLGKVNSACDLVCKFELL